MKITLEMTENTPKAREKLAGHYGEGYMVKYADVKLKESRLAIAVCRVPEFTFPAFAKRPWPVLEPRRDKEGVALQNYILSWYRMKDWRE